MKNLHKIIIGFVAAAAVCVGSHSCTDPIKFGNDFLEKAPGGTVTADTVFTNAEYTRQFLTAIYAMQYYALPTNSTNSPPQCRNYWKGMPDALSDCIQFFFSNTIVNNKYYTGALTSSYDSNGNGTIYPYINEYVWENVRNCYILLENIDRCDDPDLTDAEKLHMKDEAKCLLANTYFIAFRFYGGLPIIESTFSGSDSEYDLPRGSVKDCVDFMVGLLDEVIKAGNLEFNLTGTTAATETGRWTLGAAMALKVKILQFAASPLFNATEPYWQGKYQMEQEDAAWYGNYDPARWTAVKTACEEFISKNAAAGNPYHITEATAKTQEAYAYAYRTAYMLESSPELIYTTRVAKSASGNDYGWMNLGGGNGTLSKANSRYAYCPTQEYVEMFPWADGTPFDWDETEAAGELDHMFIKGDRVEGKQMLQNRVYTRDPRLYENVAVNGQLQTIDWGSGKRSGANFETWVGGTDAQQKAIAQNDHYGTGYRYLKYTAGAAFKGKYPQWTWLSIADVYLTYAEAIVQSGGSYKDACKYIDLVRARTGLGGIEACSPKLDLSNKDVLIEEILRERACEFLFDDVRYFDMIRYKRADLFERHLHQLLIYRIVDGKRSETQWYNSDRTKAAEGSELWYEPSHFEYVKKEITGLPRVWWTQGYDPKWYLNPFPLSEINKGYGLVQNPGW